MTKEKEKLASITPLLAVVTLDAPITIGDNEISQIQLRQPKSGELRGLNMIDIVQLDIDAIHTLVPRISQPTISEEQVSELPPSDLFAISTEIANFFLPKDARVD